MCCVAVSYALAAANFNSRGYDKRAVEYAGKALEASRFQPDEDESAYMGGRSSFASRVKEGQEANNE